MCDAGDTLTPAAREQVGAILADVVVGPVDLGPPRDALSRDRGAEQAS
jgi:hypothetical protein